MAGEVRAGRGTSAVLRRGAHRDHPSPAFAVHGRCNRSQGRNRRLRGNTVNHRRCLRRFPCRRLPHSALPIASRSRRAVQQCRGWWRCCSRCPWGRSQAGWFPPPAGDQHERSCHRLPRPPRNRRHVCDGVKALPACSRRARCRGPLGQWLASIHPMTHHHRQCDSRTGTRAWPAPMQGRGRCFAISTACESWCATTMGFTARA